MTSPQIDDLQNVRYQTSNVHRYEKQKRNRPKPRSEHSSRHVLHSVRPFCTASFLVRRVPSSQHIIPATTASVDITLGAAPDKVWKLITTFVALPLAINSLPFVMITFVVLNYCSRNDGNLVLSGGASGLRISSSDSIRALKKSVLFPLGTTVSLRS